MSQDKQNIDGWMVIHYTVFSTFVCVCVRKPESLGSMCERVQIMDLSPSLGSYFLHVGFISRLFPWGGKDGPQ